MQKLKTSHSRYWKRHCQVQQLRHRPQTIHPWNSQRQTWALHIHGGKSASKQPHFVSAKCHVKHHIPAPNSFIWTWKERLLLHLWNTVESPSSCPGTPAHEVRALQCNNAVCSQHNSIPTATKPEKTSKIRLEITATQLQTHPLPCPMNPPTLQSNTLGPFSSLPAPDNSHFKNH